VDFIIWKTLFPSRSTFLNNLRCRFLIQYKVVLFKTKIRCTGSFTISTIIAFHKTLNSPSIFNTICYIFILQQFAYVCPVVLFSHFLSTITLQTQIPGHTFLPYHLHLFPYFPGPRLLRSFLWTSENTVMTHNY